MSRKEAIDILERAEKPLMQIFGGLNREIIPQCPTAILVAQATACQRLIDSEEEFQRVLKLANP